MYLVISTYMHTPYGKYSCYSSGMDIHNTPIYGAAPNAQGQHCAHVLAIQPSNLAYLDNFHDGLMEASQSQ